MAINWHGIFTHWSTIFVWGLAALSVCLGAVCGLTNLCGCHGELAAAADPRLTLVHVDEPLEPEAREEARAGAGEEARIAA